MIRQNLQPDLKFRFKKSSTQSTNALTAIVCLFFSLIFLIYFFTQPKRVANVELPTVIYVKTKIPPHRISFFATLQVGFTTNTKQTTPFSSFYKWVVRNGLFIYLFKKMWLLFSQAMKWSTLLWIKI